MGFKLKCINKITILLLLFSTADSYSVELRVPSQYPTIRDAVDASVIGDTVIVSDGVYTGTRNKNIYIGYTQPITIRSENGPKNCIIDCEGDGRAFYIYAQGYEGLKISGFTIQNGYAGTNFTTGGGAIYCKNADYSPTISNCIFRFNEGSFGGAIFNESYSPLKVNNCIFIGNSANWGGALHERNHSGATLVYNSTFVNNVADQGESIFISGVVYFHLYNSILRGFTTDQIRNYGVLGNLVVEYNNILGGYSSGIGNIDENPDFVDLTGPDGILGTNDDNVNLESGSPCIDSGTSNGAPEFDMVGMARFDDPNTPNTGAGDISYYDMGALEYLLIDNCPNDPDKTQPGVCGCGIPDTDTDSDGTPDCNDDCPNDKNKTEPGVCGCGIADTDIDLDEILDCNDNCPSKSNPNQLDNDGDGDGNLCDTDDDNDGMPDVWELQYNLNPIANDASLDSDGDGFSNIREFLAKTDPRNPESFPEQRALPCIPLLLLDD